MRFCIRALDYVNSQSAIVPITRTPSRENKYRWLAALFQYRVLLATEGKPAPSSIEAAQDLRIGIVAGGALDQENVLGKLCLNKAERVHFDSLNARKLATTMASASNIEVRLRPLANNHTSQARNDGVTPSIVIFIDWVQRALPFYIDRGLRLIIPGQTRIHYAANIFAISETPVVENRSNENNAEIARNIASNNHGLEASLRKSVTPDFHCRKGTKKICRRFPTFRWAHPASGALAGYGGGTQENEV